MKQGAAEHCEIRNSSENMNFARSDKSLDSELHPPSPVVGRADNLSPAGTAVVEDGPLGGL
jgi:hypothetical protein